MAQKQSIFGRIAQLTRANINALLDSSEDPQKMLDQLIRDYTGSIAEAEQAVASTIGNLRLLEKDRAEDAKSVEEWGRKARAASQKADQLRGSGQAVEADRFDSLAKVALKRQISAEQEVAEADPNIASQTEVVEKLKVGLNGMNEKLNELRSKRDELVARAKTAEAQTKVTEALGSIDIMDPTSEVSRFEEKVRREEARVMGRQELAASSIDRQFESLEDMSTDLDVDARLAAMKEK